MHEYSLVEGIVESVKDELQKRQIAPEDVESVYLRVGVLALHSVESFEQAFHMQVQDSPLKNAALKVEVSPGKFECACGYTKPLNLGEIDPHDPVLECPQCHQIGRASGGMGLEAFEIEVSTDK
ncbi:hydrogenase maturation nickel metallochaperone HypA [Candidatus Sumerlaeota bacterium]|nr:hydrogenase maturation nickel metallochaperone HypA [Candidatus Sumerlaeota bacterium]